MSDETPAMQMDREKEREGIVRWTVKFYKDCEVV